MELFMIYSLFKIENNDKQKSSVFSTLRTSSMALLISCTLSVLTGCGEGNGKQISDPLPENPATGQAGDGNLAQIVEYIRIDSQLPALAAVLVHDGQIIEMAAKGYRDIGNTTVKVTNEDKWHLGSLTKSMTSTLAAKLVQLGIMSWDTSIADVYPDLLGSMHSQYEHITFKQLLSHTSGMRANLPNLNSYGQSTIDIQSQRQKMLEEALNVSPEVAAGTYLYSNLGYMVAGAMMERLTGTSWEWLLEQNLFNNLAMTSSGFGVPDAGGDLSQPVGHFSQGSGWEASNTDNPAVLGPAGTVHASLDDMGNYIAAHLAGAKGLDVAGLLTALEFNQLHSVSGDSDYALGWVVGNNTLSHSGSNTRWLAQITIYPEKNMAIFIVTNAADMQKEQSQSLKAVDALTTELVQRAETAFLN